MDRMAFHDFKPSLQNVFMLFASLSGALLLGLAVVLVWQLRAEMGSIPTIPLILLGTMVAVFFMSVGLAMLGMRRYILGPVNSLLTAVPCIKSNSQTLQEQPSFIYEFADLANSVQELGKCYIGKSYYADAMHNSEEQLHDILEASPSGFAIVEQNSGHIMVGNLRFTELLEIPEPKRRLAQNADNLNKSRLGRMILEKLKEPSEQELDLYCPMLDAQETGLWIKVYSRPIRYFDQNAVLVWLSDLTEEYIISDRLRQKNLLLEMLYATAIAANEISTPHEAIRSVLEQVCSHTGWELGHLLEVEQNSPPLLVSSGIWSCGTDDAFNVWCQETMTSTFAVGQGLPGIAAQSGEPVHMLRMSEEPDTERGPAAQNDGIVGGVAFPVYANGRLVAVAEFAAKNMIDLDVYLRQALVQISDQLGQVILREQLENEAQEAIHSAEDANKTKSLFLANMSHELRTPLNAIIGFSDTMRLGVMGPLNNETYEEYVKYIYGSGTHLLELINSVLDISKIEADKMDIYEEPVVVDALIENACAIVSQRAQEKGVTLSQEIASHLPMMLVDQMKVKQAVINILTNAIKFTPPGGNVHLSIKRPKINGLVIEVEDTGVGIAKDEMEKALMPFEQTQSGLKSREGTGLGLPISKHFMEMHGGSLEIDSTEGKGTRVRLSFPKERIVDNALLTSA